jgi:Skp family chaperone for outer membrane proteins
MKKPEDVMFFKKYLTLAVLSAGILFLGAAASEGALKIGVIDMDEAFSAYDKAAGISEKVRSIALEGSKERLNLREEIALLEREIRDKSETLPEKGIEQIKRNLQQKVQEYRDFEQKQKDIETKPVHEALEHIYKKVDSYAKAHGYDLILEQRVGLFGKTVLFSAEELDITEEIIKTL